MCDIGIFSVIAIRLLTCCFSQLGDDGNLLSCIARRTSDSAHTMYGVSPLNGPIIHATNFARDIKDAQQSADLWLRPPQRLPQAAASTQAWLPIKPAPPMIRTVSIAPSPLLQLFPYC
jgi:hypothetical protein